MVMVQSQMLRKTLHAFRPMSSRSSQGTATPPTRDSSPSPPPLFPIELVERIIYELRDSPSTLRSLALVSRAISPLALQYIWRAVPVGLHHKSPLRTSYFGPSTTKIMTLGLIKLPPFPNLAVDLRSMTRVIDFYFYDFQWALSLYRREHRYRDSFSNLAVLRVHLDSLCGYMSSSGRPLKYRDEDYSLENYAPRLPACGKVVFIGPTFQPYYDQWIASWDRPYRSGQTELRERAPRKVVLLLDGRVKHSIHFRPASFARKTLNALQAEGLEEVVVLFWPGGRGKLLTSIQVHTWRTTAKDMVDMMVMARKKFPRARFTWVNAGCFRPKWMQIDQNPKEAEVMEAVKADLRIVGETKGVKLFERWDEGEGMDVENEMVSMRREKERVISLDEYLAEGDAEGELESGREGKWLQPL
ncbi:hypothetical protein IAT38_005538 [Cryptococcus sp. DSM 104549]